MKRVLILLGFAVPYIFIYKAFFLGGPLAFGDAPYFYPENLKELFNLPFLWNFKDNNFGAPQYYILWLYIPTFLYGLFNNFLGLGNDILTRLVFYFPATILAIFGSWKLIGIYNQNTAGRFLGSFLYGFNTYFLMLVDGGQVGVALAYGIFPLAAFSILSYFGKPTVKSFLCALVSLFSLMSADVRIAIVLILFVGGLWVFGEIREGSVRLKHILKKAFILGLAVLGLSGYWVVPTLKSGIGGLEGVGGLGEGSNFIALSNTLFLFQPHFPLNQFGMIFPVPFYFVFLPIAIFGGIILTKEGSERKVIIHLSLLFLIFAFLAKGGSEPLGNFYQWIVSNIPLGVSFRDSSKFFIPLIMTAVILLSLTVSNLKILLKGKRLMLATLFVYSYLILLIYPALLGTLSGTLGGANDSDYFMIYQNLKNDTQFRRSLWIKEKPSFSYSGWSKPAISADQLIKERPFASINAGKDALNFMNFPQTPEWFKLLGIKYVFLSGDERIKIWTKEGLEERDEMKTLAGSLPGLKVLEWPISFPAYEVIDPAPHIFAQKKALVVLGGEDVYDQLDFKKSSLSGQGFIFLEDGRTSPSDLHDLNPDAVLLIFNGKDIRDLQMTFLQKSMVSPREAKLSQWQSRASGDYLTWKYDLLKQGIELKEFDFGKGVAFSTVAGEKIGFKLQSPKSDNYYLGLRYTNATTSAGLKVVLSDFEKDILNNNPKKFTWELIGPLKVNKESIEFNVSNKGGFAMLNTVALFSEEDFLKSEKAANDLADKFKTSELADLSDKFLPVKSYQINPTEYKVGDIPQGARWLVFSDRYNKGWKFQGRESVNFPFYAMINGFYLSDMENITIYFSPQEDVRPGMIISVTTLALIILGTAFLRLRKRYE